MNRPRRENGDNNTDPRINNKISHMNNCSDISHSKLEDDKNEIDKPLINERLKRAILINNGLSFRTPSPIDEYIPTSTEEVILVDKQNPPNQKPVLRTTTIRPKASFHVQPVTKQPTTVEPTSINQSRDKLYTVYGPPSGTSCHKVACLERDGTSSVHCLNMATMFIQNQENFRPLHSKRI